MSLFTCCFWWFVLGVLLGWLLNWLFSKLFRRGDSVSAPTASASDSSASLRTTRTEPVPPPVARAAPPVERSAVSPSRLIDVGAARAAGFNLKHADDLTIIEGIGPKIDELFRSNGVTTFAEVSQMSVAEMLAILEKGGPNFKLANPESWAQQALLAAENRWAELKVLQDELVGGVDRRGDH